MPSLYAQAESPKLDAQLLDCFTRYISLADDLHQILSSVQDKESASKATDALIRIMPRVYSCRCEMEALSELSEEQQAILRKTLEINLRTSWGKAYEEIFRLHRAQCFLNIPFAQQLQALCTMLND